MGWLACSRAARLDEFLLELRDRSYRVAFRLLVLGCLVLVPGVVLGAYLRSPISWGISDPVVTRGLAAVLVLLVVLPTKQVPGSCPR